jgi:putative transcriptional regulator
MRLPIACEQGLTTALVLAGAAGGGVARYERGDVIFTGAEIAGEPTAEAGEDCVCFVVAEAPARPAGPLSRMLNLVTGG